MKRLFIVILILCNFRLAYAQSYQGPMELPYEVQKCFGYTWGSNKEVYGSYNFYVKDGKRVKHGAASFEFGIGNHFHHVTGQYSNGKMTGVWKNEVPKDGPIDERYNIITYTFSDGERKGKFIANSQWGTLPYPKKGIGVGDAYSVIYSVTGFIQNNKPIGKLKIYYNWNKNNTITLLFDNNGCLNGDIIVETERYKEVRTYNHGLLVYCSLLDKSTGDLSITDNLNNLKLYAADKILSTAAIDGYYLIKDNDSLYYAKQIDISHSRLDYLPFGFYFYDREAFYDTELILKMYCGLDITHPTSPLFAVEPNEQETIRKKEEEAKIIAEKKKIAEDAMKMIAEKREEAKKKKEEERRQRDDIIKNIHAGIKALGSKEIAQKISSVRFFSITNNDHAKLRKSCINCIHDNCNELNRIIALEEMLSSFSEEAFKIKCEKYKVYSNYFSDTSFKKLYIFAKYGSLSSSSPFSNEELKYLNSELKNLYLERRKQAKYLDSMISLYENINTLPRSTKEWKILNKHIKEGNAAEIQKFWNFGDVVAL